MVKKWGVLLLGALASATVLIAGANAVAVPVSPLKVDLSSRAAVTKYLASHGIDSKTFVIQRGARNYAGKHCPGKGWNCTTAKRVVQISYLANVSTFTCTPSSGGSATSPNDCLIVQFSNTSNNATCTEKTTGADVTQSCRILQSTTTGSNLANVQQQIDATTGAIQTGDQYAGVEQDTTNGTNSATISQVLNQTTTVTAAGVQEQNGYQTSSVLQNTTLGTNSAGVTQSETLKATAANLPFVSQSQNTDATEPNTQSSIRQNNGTTLNTANLNQSHNLDATVNQVTTANADAGRPERRPARPLRAVEHRHVVRDRRPERAAAAPRNCVPNLTQTQWGPMCFGSDQGSNPLDRYTITPELDAERLEPGRVPGRSAVRELRYERNVYREGDDDPGRRDAQQHLHECRRATSDRRRRPTGRGRTTRRAEGLDSESSSTCPSPPYPRRRRSLGLSSGARERAGCSGPLSDLGELTVDLGNEAARARALELRRVRARVRLAPALHLRADEAPAVRESRLAKIEWQLLLLEQAQRLGEARVVQARASPRRYVTLASQSSDAARAYGSSFRQRARARSRASSRASSSLLLTDQRRRQGSR